MALAAFGERSMPFSDAEGDVEYYLDSASSTCVIASDATLDFNSSFRIKGSCAKSVSESYIEGKLKSMSAKKVLEERVGNTVSTYYYTNKIWGYKLINGKKVNIHVAICGENAAIGSPMIFGAY